MSQQNIDFGSFPDDPSADAIRTAFQKVQNNFTQLFNANAESAVLSVNRTPGAGITVNSPTGNVVVSANIACVRVSTTSLVMGTGADNTKSNATIVSSSQTLNIDINPALVQSNYFADVGNGLAKFNGILTANSNSQPNITSFGTLTGLNVSGNVSFTGSNVSISNVQHLHIPGGSSGYVLATTGSGNLFWSAVATGNGTPGGNPNSVQFNNSGGFGGSANFTYDDSIQTLTVNGNIITNSISANTIATPITTDDLFVTGQLYIDWLDGNGQPFPGVGIVASTTNIYDIGSPSGKFANAYFNANIYAGNASLGNLVTASYFSGDGGLLSNLNIANGIVANANYSNFAGTVTTASQSNITSLGTLTGLTVNGNANATNFNATGNMIISGNLTVQGNATYYNVTSFDVEDPVISLGGGPNGNALISNDGKDRGIELQYYTTTPVTSFMGWVNANSEFAFGSNVTIPSNGVVTFNSLGNVRGLTWLGNIVGSFANFANANLGNSANANYFIGNLYGTANTANIANTVSVNAQPNITSLGTLTTLAVTGNTTSGNFIGILANGNSNVTVLGGGNINFNAVGVSVANITGTGINVAGTGNFTGNLSAPAFYGILANGNSNVNIPSSNGNVVLTAVGNSVLTVTGTGANITGTANISGTANIGNLNTYIANATYLRGDGSNITNLNITAGTSIINGTSNVSIPASNGNVNTVVAGNTTLVVTGTGVNVAGTINATGIITGNGSGLSSIAGANVSGIVANANYSAYSGIAGTANAVAGANVSGQVGNALVAGTVYTAAQPAITSVGTLTGLSVNGTLTAVNITANTGLITGTLATAAQPNITSVGTLTSLNVIGNISGANVTGNHYGSGNNLSNIQASNVSGTVANANNSAYLNTYTQSSANTASTIALRDSNGNLSANYFIGNGSQLTGVGNAQAIVNGNSNVNITSPNANITMSVAGNSNIVVVNSSGANITGNLGVSGVTSLGNVGNVVITGGTTGQYLQTNGSGNLIWATVSSIVPGAYVYTQSSPATTWVVNHNLGVQFLNVEVIDSTGNSYDGRYNYPTVTFNNNSTLTITFSSAQSGYAAVTSGGGAQGANANVGGANTQVQFNSSNVLAGSSAFTFNSASNVLTVGGNIISNNANLGNAVNANYFIGSGNNLSNIQGANVSGAVGLATYATTANAVAGANVTGQVGNALIAGTVYTNAQTNITSVGTLTSLTVSGNTTAGNLTATNTVTAANFNGSGAGTPTITSATNLDLSPSVAVRVVGSGVLTATSNITTPQFISNVTTGTAPLVVTSTTQVANLSVATAGTVTNNAQPNITSIGTLTSLAVTGNITSANITTSAFVVRSVGTGISAAGSTQGTATSISKEINVVSTVGSGQGVILPVSVAGMVIHITNTSANSVIVYPASGGAVNSLSTNAGYTQSAGATITYIAPTTTQWYTAGATYA
jgi:hypothetical protein